MSLDFERYRARRVRAQVLSLLDDLRAAIERRDAQAVWDVLDEATAVRTLPRAVREEALVIVRLSRKSHRAPIRLYQFQEQLRQLGDEPLEWGDPDQLDLGMPGGAGAAPWHSSPPPRSRSGGS
jgi:hypothetical protein